MCSSKRKRKLERKSISELHDTNVYLSPPSRRCCRSPSSFYEDHGRDNLDEGILHCVLSQGGRGARVLAIAMVGMGVIAVDVVIELRRGSR